MTAISYHDTVNDLQGLGFLNAGPFSRPEWFALLEKSGASPFIALARQGKEALALPFVRNGVGLETFTNWYAFTWTALATSDAARSELLEGLTGQLSRHTGRIVLSKLPDEDGTASNLERAFRKAGWFVRREPCDRNHVLTVKGRAYAAYLSDRPGHLRTTLKRKATKVDVRIYGNFHNDVWLSYEKIYASSWKPEEGDPALLRRFAQTEGAAGRLRMGLALHRGKAVAAQMWTVDHDTAYIHKLAHLESARQLSAGTTLTAALFKRAIDQDRVELVDFGTGDDPYKRDWMEEVRLRYRLICLRPEKPANWPAIGKALLRQLVSRPGRL